MIKKTSKTQAAGKRHPIQVVARRTGLTSDVLRAWEKRYGVVEPGRSDSGRRLYSDADIEHLRLLRQATAAGRSIGQVADLPVPDLEALVREDQAAPPPPGPAEPGPEAGAVMDAAFAAVRDLDGRRLHAILNRAMVELPAAEFIDSVVVPLLRRIGVAWEASEIRPAHEHLATPVIQRLLSHLIATLEVPDAAPHVVLATPVHTRHDLGAMLAAASAAAAGWRVTYLGADLPAADIAEAARLAQAQVVGLSIVHPRDDRDLVKDLRTLRRALPADVVLAVGGRAAPAYQEVLTEVGALRFQDLATFRATLTGLALEGAGAS